MEAAFGRLHKNGGSPPIFMDPIMLDNVSVYVNVICFIKICIGIFDIFTDIFDLFIDMFDILIDISV